MSDFTQIRYEVSESIATITLNRPEKMNAFTGVMMREMLEVFDVIDADDSVRAVIVTGEGKAFCAGADLSGGAKTFDDGDWSSPSGSLSARSRSSQPSTVLPWVSAPP
jgi:enoyl-CoA hydratase/carnithine racemase